MKKNQGLRTHKKYWLDGQEDLRIFCAGRTEKNTRAIAQEKERQNQGSQQMTKGEKTLFCLKAGGSKQGQTGMKQKLKGTNQGPIGKTQDTYRQKRMDREKG